MQLIQDTECAVVSLVTVLRSSIIFVGVLSHMVEWFGDNHIRNLAGNVIRFMLKSFERLECILESRLTVVRVLSFW